MSLHSFMHGVRTSASQTAAMATASLFLAAARSQNRERDASLYLYATLIAAGAAAYSVADRVDDKAVYLVGRLPLGAINAVLNERLADAAPPAKRRSLFLITTAVSAALGVSREETF